MNINQKMFLLAVEELNFSKAAIKAFVTQQCLSLHIKKLEEEYDVKLFARKPRLHLTAAGEALHQSLCHLQVTETALLKRLADIKDGRRGEIIFGINATRARVIMPNLITSYQKLFPLVKISLILDDTLNLATKLLDGKLDMFLGIDCVANNDFDVLNLAYDEVFFIARESVLKKFSNNQELLTHALASKEINLLNFPNMPFVGNYKGSSFNTLVSKYLYARNIQQNVVFSVSDYEIQIEVCSQGEFVVFCPKMVLSKVFEQNAKILKDEKLHIFKLQGMNNSLKVDLITHKQAYKPYFMQEFITMFQEHIAYNKNFTERYYLDNTDRNATDSL